MIRLLLRLFNIKDYEVCPSCETLKKQLEYTREQNKELTETLLNLVKPTIVAQPVETKVIAALNQGSGASFARRRGILEEAHKVKREIIRTSPFIAESSRTSESVKDITPTSISDLETSLGLEDKPNVQG